jgi:hypothetical protein
MGDKVIKEIDHGVRMVGGVQVRVEQEVWELGGSSFSVYHVADGIDLTQAIHGQCYDTMPSDEEIAVLLVLYVEGYRDPGYRGS